MRGSELLKQGRLDQAQRAFRAALELDDRNPKVLALLGLAHFRAGEFDAARPIYQDLVEIAPTDASHRLNLGLVYLKLNDAEHAITALEASRALDPSRGRAVSYLGLAYARAGRYAEAYRSFLLAGQNELATEIEVNLSPSEREGIHAQLGPGVRPATAPKPPATPRAPTPPAGATVASGAGTVASGAGMVENRTGGDTAEATSPKSLLARTISEPRTRPPTAPPGSKARAQQVEPEPPPSPGGPSSQATKALSPGGTSPQAAKASLAISSSEITIERTSEADIVAVQPDPMSDSQQFVLQPHPVDDAAPRPFDGQSMVSRAVAAAAATPAVDESRTRSGALPPRPLSQIATEDLVRPDDGTDVFEVNTDGALLLRITDRLLTRLDGVHVSGGELAYELAMRRSRGHQTDEPFAARGATFHVVSGNGFLIAVPPRRHTFTAVALDDDILYLRDDLVFAFEASLRWENGNVPGLRGQLQVVQFRGDGAIALLLARPLVRVKLPPAGLLFVEAARLAGWIGRVIPRAVVPPSGGPLGPMCVECTGEGIVLIEPAPQDEATSPRRTRSATGEARAEPPPPPPPSVARAPAVEPEVAEFAADLAAHSASEDARAKSRDEF